ncbi:MAG TPA: hypothetical protein PK490_15960 [Prosthecobacter sp.]|nr:hypothetical protein [Prosthecobacter sp.]HRK15778.1 hypothetical protein [Prosthecobacter sp.]
MTLKLKALLLALGMVVIFIAAHDLVLEIGPRQPTPQEAGLAWLKSEYRIPDESFEKIKALHEEYFARCDAMCAQMLAARGTAPRVPTRNVPAENVRLMRQRAEAAGRAREKALCESCLETMVSHLETVAALMTEGQGERFLKDLLPDLVNPRELQELRAQTRPVQ